MKKLIIINLVLSMLIYILKDYTKTEIVPKVENEIIEEITQNEEVAEIIEEIEEKQEEIIKNTTLELESDLRELSNFTAYDFDEILVDTALYGLGSAFEEAEKESNINGLYLVGLACLESQYGTSNFAVNRNNIMGWNAVDKNPQKATYFDTKEYCIKYVASRLKVNYLTENAKYFAGYTVKDIDTHYCTDPLHAKTIVNIVKKLTSKNIEG